MLEYIQLCIYKSKEIKNKYEKVWLQMQTLHQCLVITMWMKTTITKWVFFLINASSVENQTNRLRKTCWHFCKLVLYHFISLY